MTLPQSAFIIIVTLIAILFLLTLADTLVCILTAFTGGRC